MSFNSINSEQSPKNILASNKIIESYTSLCERKKYPEISLALKNDKKIRFGLLSNLKPKLIDIKGIHNENKLKLVNRINSFRKIYFDNYNNQGFSMKEIRSLKKENSFFSRNYKIMKEKCGENKKQYFKDIKDEYEKKNYYVPALFGNKKNIFNGNILLYNDNELQNFILYDIGTKKSNKKSLFFLEKIQNEIINRRNVKEGKPQFIVYKNPLLEHKSNFDKIVRDKKKEIKKSKSEIKKLKNTLNIMDEIDFFFNSDNKQYLNMLKYEDSRESSAKISTRVNSPIGLFENIKFNNNFNIYNNRNNILENINTENTNATNNANSIIETVNSPVKNKINILDLSDFSNNEPITDRNDSIYIDIMKRNKKIKIIKNSNSVDNKNNLNLDNKKKIRIKTRTITRKNKENFKTTLEKLYERITKKGNNNNLLKFNNQINKYINSHKNKFSFSFEGIKDISPYYLSNKIENDRQKICNRNYIKDDAYLRRINGGTMESIDKLNRQDFNIKQNMTKNEDKIIKIYCDLDNPKNVKN